MKIAMIGSGAAGSVFAAYLRRGGAELYLVDRYKAHMDKIASDGWSSAARARSAASPVSTPPPAPTACRSWI